MHVLPALREVAMKRPRRILFVIAGMLPFTTPTASAAERALERATLSQLATLPSAQPFDIDTFPVGPTKSATIRFQRVSIYAADARIYAETPAGRVEVPRSDLIFLRGYSDDGSARVALTLSPQFAILHGSGQGP